MHDYVDTVVGPEDFVKQQIRNLRQFLKDVNFSNSLHGRREIFSMFVFFMLFFGIALILASKKIDEEGWERRP